MTYAARSGAVVVDIDGNADDGSGLDSRTATTGDNVKTDVENLIGTSAADTLTGSSLGNRLDGGLGADILRGLGASDVLFTRDGVADTEIQCEGGGTAGGADQALLDTVDPAPLPGCESVTRA